MHSSGLTSSHNIKYESVYGQKVCKVSIGTRGHTLWRYLLLMVGFSLVWPSRYKTSDQWPHESKYLINGTHPRAISPTLRVEEDCLAASLINCPVVNAIWAAKIHCMCPPGTGGMKKRRLHLFEHEFAQRLFYEVFASWRLRLLTGIPERVLNYTHWRWLFRTIGRADIIADCWVCGSGYVTSAPPNRNTQNLFASQKVQAAISCSRLEDSF